MLSSSDEIQQPKLLHPPQQRRAPVAQQLSLLPPLITDGAAPVWITLDPTQRAEVIHRLARLIAQATPPSNDQPPPRDAQEPTNE